MPLAHSLRALHSMQIAGLLLSLLLLPVLPGAAQQAASHPNALAYANPLPFSYTTSLPAPGSMHTELRDPCIIRDSDRYYLVFTMWPFTDIGTLAEWQRVKTLLFLSAFLYLFHAALGSLPCRDTLRLRAACGG